MNEVFSELIENIYNLIENKIIDIEILKKDLHFFKKNILINLQIFIDDVLNRDNTPDKIVLQFFENTKENVQVFDKPILDSIKQIDSIIQKIIEINKGSDKYKIDDIYKSLQEQLKEYSELLQTQICKAIEVIVNNKKIDLILQEKFKTELDNVTERQLEVFLVKGDFTLNEWFKMEPVERV